MAVSGIITKQLDSTYKIYIDFKWQRKSFSQANNTSTIAWEIILRDEAVLAWFSADTQTISLDIDGTVTNETISVKEFGAFSSNASQTVSSGTRVIKHKADGTKDFTVKFTYKDGHNNYHNLTGSFTLDRITRASGVTCTTVNIGVAPTITIDSQDSSYKHTLSYGFGDQEQGYITGTIATSTNKLVINDFVWPQSFYQVIPNSTSGTGTIFCTTYNSSGAIVGEQTRCDFTANANEASSSPVFDDGYPIIKDKNSFTKALTGDESKLIRYASTAYVEIGAKGRNYATIARQKVKNDTAYHEEYTNDLVSIAFGNVPSPIFSFELEDSRGYISKPGRDLSATGRFIEYFHPTCRIGNDKPTTNGNLTINCSGSWFNDTFGAENNSITVQYRYKLSSADWQNTESEWYPMTVSISENTYDATATLDIPNFDYLAGYTYQARVKDKIFTSHSIEYETKSSAIFSWSDQDFEFNVPVKFNAGTEGCSNSGGGGSDIDLSQYALKSDIPPNYSTGGTMDGDLTVTGNLRLKGDGNYGNKIYMGDGTYVSFSEDSDDDLTIKASNINLNGYVTVNGEPIMDGGESGYWTPLLTSIAVTSYTVQEGWYQRVGKVVTVGFNIKATCSSGYQSTSISINGLPFKPLYDASGGGICSGAYVSAGFNFECWVAGSNSNTITGRVQACNNTSNANLSTSASGLFYRSGGGEITLGGTICYMIN